MAEEQVYAVLLLGNVDHEGIVSNIKTSGYSYQKRLLDSGPDNWLRIADLLDSRKFAAVVAKLTPVVYTHLASPLYRIASERLLDALSKHRTMLFAFDSLMDLSKTEEEVEGIRGEYEDEFGFFLGHKHEIPPADLRKSVNEKLANAGLEAISYSKNAELTVMASQFIREVISNLLFRLYIPHGRLYASEMDKLLQLFKDFLDRTGQRGITLNRVDAERGTSYEFCGDYQGRQPLSTEFAAFTEFMNLCVTDVDKARNMLTVKAVAPNQISRIVDRYTKEARRLSLDMTHEREVKLLGIRHRLESELTDTLLPHSASADVIRRIVDDAVPQILDTGIRANLFESSQTGLSTSRVDVGTLERAREIAIEEISSHEEASSYAGELLRFVRRHGGASATDIESNLREAGDKGIPESLRLTKTQRLKTFFYGLAPDVAKAGLQLLEEYLKQKV